MKLATLSLRPGEGVTRVRVAPGCGSKEEGEG